MLPVPGFGTRHRRFNHLTADAVAAILYDVGGQIPLQGQVFVRGKGPEGPPPSKKTLGVGVFVYDLWTGQETSTQEAEEKAKRRSSQQPVGNHNANAGLRFGFNFQFGVLGLPSDSQERPSA